MSQDQLNDMQPSDHTSDTARANAPQSTPTLRESIERTLVTYGGHAGNPQARMNLDNRIAELESLLSDRIREELETVKKMATEHCPFKIDQYGSDLDTKDVRLAVPVRKIDARIAALQEKRNDNE